MLSPVSSSSSSSPSSSAQDDFDRLSILAVVLARCSPRPRHHRKLANEPSPTPSCLASAKISPSRSLSITSEHPLSLLLPLQYRRRASGWRSNRPLQTRSRAREIFSFITRVVAPPETAGKSSVWQICPSCCQTKEPAARGKKNVDPASVGRCHAAAVQLQVHQFGVFFLLLFLFPCHHLLS